MFADDSGASLRLHAPVGLPEFAPGVDIVSTLTAALTQAGSAVRSGDVVIICQKIVSKTEGRVVPLANVTPSPYAQQLAAQCGKDPRLVELVLAESEAVVRCVPTVLIVRHRLGFTVANAGVDQSNLPGGGEGALLLPLDPDASARRLRDDFKRQGGIDVGVVINDSFGRPWRMGVCGVAIGSAGLIALKDMRGTHDRFGRPLQVTQMAVADELAAAASLLMGQAAEGRPIVIARGLHPALFGDGAASDLVRPGAMDLFR
jgi:coenzyme F420-0:L-glutamate ligase/coenzyme F420-1:gamma-L-glutamate ligase